MSPELAVDLFCRVIDNYGDIGVCWRLARQLAHEHGAQVRLIVDDLASFRYLAPEIDPARSEQTLAGVTVLRWPADDTPPPAPADVVIEAFACDPPPAYVHAMAAREPKPVWLNLEYLSAEAWVDDIHGRPSPHPRLPLVKYFFCPGFTERSGGLLRERGLVPSPAMAGSGPGWGAAPNAAESLKVFAFTYPEAPVHALVTALAAAGRAAEVTTAAPLTNRNPAWPSAQAVPQPEFDALLARFDVLLVRGEDSFVRAQWAGKPLLWHIYPTEDAAHVVKLDAWLDRYCAGLEPGAAAAYRAASRAFVHGDSDAAEYAGFAAHLPALQAHALRWRDALAAQPDLATRLVAFIALAEAQKVG